MVNNVIRIRLTSLPSPRDMEFFALKYLSVNGYYEVPLELAKDLVEFGYAMPNDGNDPISSISEVQDIPEDTD